MASPPDIDAMKDREDLEGLAKALREDALDSSAARAGSRNPT